MKLYQITVTLVTRAPQTKTLWHAIYPLLHKNCPEYMVFTKIWSLLTSYNSQKTRKIVEAKFEKNNITISGPTKVNKQKIPQSHFLAILKKSYFGLIWACPDMFEQTSDIMKYI